MSENERSAILGYTMYMEIRGFDDNMGKAAMKSAFGTLIRQ